MPWFEDLLIALILLAGLLAFRTSTGRAATTVLSAVAGLVLVLHLIFEGAHWQMAPAYLALVLCTAIIFVSALLLRRLAALAVIGLALLACALSIYLPVFKLPAPTGSYAIGTQILPLVNASPKTPGAALADGKRPLMIQVWYPAALSDDPIAPYRIRRETTLLSSYQSVVRTHARWNAPVASGSPFPVLLLNPAWSARRSAYMYLVEDLVSHGYIVIGIDHTGNSGPVAFPDGHVSIPPPDTGLDSETHTYEEMNAYATKAQAIQVEDDEFVINQLDLWNRQPGGFYQGKLDTGRIGAFGHSFGGSVSAEICSEDPRVKAALDLDGSYWPPIQNNGLRKPLMMIEEDYTQFSAEQLKNDHVDAVEYAFDQSDDRTMANSNGYRAILHGSTHPSYTDRSLFSPFKRQSGVGTIPALREYAIIRSYALAFFNKTLMGIDSPLLSAQDRSFPEATLTILKRPLDPREVQSQMAPLNPSK